MYEQSLPLNMLKLRLVLDYYETKLTMHVLLTSN